MRFAVGYQLAEDGEESTVDLVRDYLESVGEVYFPWLDMPSGRAPVATRRGYTDWTAQRRMEEDLVEFRRMGVKLDLLMNASCYGGRAVSRHLEAQVASVIEHLGALTGGVDVVTTTSPAVARAVKAGFPEVEVRASVNMRVGTVRGMEYLADLFDGYYVQRELNRDLERLGELKTWADSAGKRLCMLANSGCLYQCSTQTFHDNMVAHEAEIDEARNIEGWTPHLCWRWLAEPANRWTVLTNTWVRPEDLNRYEGLFDLVKLATRMHSHPRMVVHAYSSGRFGGNLLDLFEPGHGPALAPYVIDSGRLPADWFERTTGCSRDCRKCGYCREVYDRVAVNTEE